MIEWIERMPDSMTGVCAAAVVWFGFNYAVLADRAMEKDGATTAVPRCVEAVGRLDAASTPQPSGVGRLIGAPELDRLEALLTERMMPRLSHREREERCACAAKGALRGLRFDYAIHTASFRLVAPQAVASLGSNVVDGAMTGLCSADTILGRR